MKSTERLSNILDTAHQGAEAPSKAHWNLRTPCDLPATCPTDNSVGVRIGVIHMTASPCWQ